MKIAMVFYGSRGDIQPGVALALELSRRGHEPTLVTPPNLVEFARKFGLKALPAGMDSSSVWDSPRAQEVMVGKNPIAKAKFATGTVRAGFAAFDRDLTALFTDADAALAGVDALLAGPLCQERVLAVAELLSMPFGVLRFGPFSSNHVIGAFPSKKAETNPKVNELSWEVSQWLTWLATGGAENSFRAKIGLPKAHGPLPKRLLQQDVLQIQAFDPSMFPGIVKDWRADDPNTARPIVGFLDLPPCVRGVADDLISDELSNWLDTAEPPTFFTFGSMPVGTTAGVLDTITQAMAKVGGRAVLSIRGQDRAGVDPENPKLFYAGSLNHAALMPRCAGAVHHGGAGTTATTLRAGLPTMICTVAADQAYWGGRVSILGVGTSTKLKTLTVQQLCEGLELIRRDDVVRSAKELAASMITAEAAVAHAADAVERKLG